MPKQTVPIRRWLLAAGAGAGVLLAAVVITPATAYPRYRLDESGGNCATCHGAFTDGTSPRGTIFPSNNKHEMHGGFDNMATDCYLCHDFAVDQGNPFTYVSLGTPDTPGLGCTGCHGRDYGGSIGSSGVGLRAHHALNGVTECAGCHDDDPDPLPEHVQPVYYGSPDTLADDACNKAPGHLENWSVGDLQGLDNDGDNLYDADDADCACPADLDGSGMVGTADLLALLAVWGGDPGGPPDFDGDGTVSTSDLLFLLSVWGPCP